MRDYMLEYAKAEAANALSLRRPEASTSRDRNWWMARAARLNAGKF